MSQSGMAGHRSISPASVNYIRANTKAAAKPRPQPTSTSQPAAAQVPIINKQGKRSHLKSKVKKAFTSAKESLKTISYICFPKSNHSSSSSSESRASYNSQVRVSFLSGTSTPSICLTKPTYRGSNVRLSLHQAPQTPEIAQTSLLTENEIPHSERYLSNRKTTRFQHPAVSDVIAGCGDLEELPTPSIRELSRDNRPCTASTIGTIDFENQVNPKRIFRNSQMLSDTQSFEAFKNVMDGVRNKSPPHAAVEAQTSLPATPPTLPYIAMAPAMALDPSEATSQPEPKAQNTEPEVTTAASNVPSTLIVPNVLAFGSKQPVPKLRVRPHTTNELLPGTNFLPYLPYNPRFNPYSASTPVANTLTPTSTSPDESSAEGLAAAFAEAEAAEQAAIHDRHTTLYAAVESGSLVSLVAATALTAGPATVTATTAAPTTASPARRTAFTIKRKPVPKRRDACTSKPLPPVPAPTSPRRFTYGIVPVVLRRDEDRYPLPKKLSPVPKRAWWRRAR